MGPVFSGRSLSLFFLDDGMRVQYDEDKRFGDVFGIFSLLAVVIACLGLLTLSAYNVTKNKEIRSKSTGRQRCRVWC